MERDSDEDDEEMLAGVAEWDYMTSEDDDESGKPIDSDSRRRQSKPGAGKVSNGGG